MATKKIIESEPIAVLEPETENAIGLEPDNIEVFGARVHNLKNIEVSIPRNQFVVITGISGSGKAAPLCPPSGGRKKLDLDLSASLR